MADFYTANSNTISPSKWASFGPPFTESAKPVVPSRFLIRLQDLEPVRVSPYRPPTRESRTRSSNTR